MSFIFTTKEFDDYTISWVEGGRIKVVNKETGKISFTNHMRSKLKKLLEFCEDHKKTPDRLIMYLNPEATKLFSHKNIEILEEDSSCYLVEHAAPNDKTYALDVNPKKTSTQLRICPKDSEFIKANARYTIDADGELAFHEDITPENFGREYEGAHIYVYATYRKA
jgi:hypothetical protein